jgi:glycosyltransferase involved in cell wall biosynthesis
LPLPARAAVVTPYFVDRDAVCNDVFHSAGALRRAGSDARVFAVGGASQRERFAPIGELASFLRDPADLCYFHFSTGQPEVIEAIARLRCRKVIKLHNITPPELFSTWSDELAEASRSGRAAIPEVARMGWEHVEPCLPAGTPRTVVPPFHETEALLGARPAAGAPGTRLLTVGRIVQSKGHPFLLRVLRYLVQELGTPAMLDIVGKPDNRMVAYVRMLALMVREYGLEAHVTFHGEVSPEALARHYGEGAAFVITSEHEGFCVPVIEAMAFGVPVVALGTTAVPETVGDAGIVWAERDPRRFALTLQRLLGEPAQREMLAARGRERYAAHFANASI